MSILYRVSAILWNVTKKIAAGIVAAFLVGYAANLAVTKVTDIDSTALVTFVNWLFLPGINRTITLSVLISLFIITSLTGILTTLGELRIGGSSAVLHKYLLSFIENYKIDAPVGFYPSPLLNLTPLPLEDFAIDLMFFPLRARYDTPIISETLRNEINNQSNLQILDLEPKQTCQSVFIKDILQNFNDKPLAMIWGTPGAGKSTTVYKLALDLARAILQPHKHHLPDGLSNMRIPILLPIRAYSKSLKTNSDLHFKDFFDIYLKEKYPEIPKLNATILSKLSQGRCLIIFDGLDENSNDQNEYIIQEIYTFISNHLKKGKKFQNYFIITSRIANYNIGRMEEFLNHYTLLDLSKSQVDIFLKKRFSCIERYIQKKKKSTDSSRSDTDLEAEVQQVGDKQSKHMLSIIADSKGIKELQFHPLFLTTLIFMYITGLLLPNSRIDAYKIITNTLLDNWNQGSERDVLTQEEVDLANHLLAELASVLHEKPPILSQQDVYKIIRETKANLHHIRPEQFSDIEIQRLIKKIRLNSGLLLVAGHNHGMDVFIFNYPCIQEYFMALHLLRKDADELKNILLQHHNELDWHESLQLVIASKNNYHSPSEAIELIKTLFDAYKQQSNTSYNDFLFITSCMIDCGAWGADDTNLRKSIANHLFEIYGLFENNSDQVHENIEKLTLL